MTWSPEAKAARDGSGWAMLAAVILAFQGVALLVYAGILRPVVLAIDLPVLGHADITYLVTGALALVAAVGIGLRRPWGRLPRDDRRGHIGPAGARDRVQPAQGDRRSRAAGDRRDPAVAAVATTERRTGST